MKIRLLNLTKRFPNRGKRARGEMTAVENLSFEIPDGTLVGLLGPSGCGKTTTLNMICGLEQPTSGQIFFGEEDVTALPPELRGVGMVFQNYALYPHLTVLQNILFPLENLAVKPACPLIRIDTGGILVYNREYRHLPIRCRFEGSFCFRQAGILILLVRSDCTP